MTNVTPKEYLRDGKLSSIKSRNSNKNSKFHSNYSSTNLYKYKNKNNFLKRSHSMGKENPVHENSPPMYSFSDKSDLRIDNIKLYESRGQLLKYGSQSRLMQTEKRTKIPKMINTNL